MENTETSTDNELATVRIEGQEFELEASLASDDRMLRTVLQPHYASVENAAITREVKDGKLVVSIVKKALHKGALDEDSSTPFERLCLEPDRLNPAISLADALMRRTLTDVFNYDEIANAEEVLAAGRAEIKRTEDCLKALVKMPPTPSSTVPAGF